MKIVAVDFGDSHTGIAASDFMEMLATPVCIIDEKRFEVCADKVAEKIKEIGGQLVVVGNPINMNGTVGESSERIMKLAEALREASGLPVVLFDERCTTMAAAQILNLTDTGGAKRKAVIDALSAEIILQNYLDSIRRLLS